MFQLSLCCETAARVDTPHCCRCYPVNYQGLHHRLSQISTGCILSSGECTCILCNKGSERSSGGRMCELVVGIKKVQPDKNQPLKYSPDLLCLLSLPKASRIISPSLSLFGFFMPSFFPSDLPLCLCLTWRPRTKSYLWVAYYTVLWPPFQCTVCLDCVWIFYFILFFELHYIYT